MSFRIRGYPQSRGAMYSPTYEHSPVALQAASLTVHRRKDGQPADKRCGCDDDPSAFCAEHAALIIELL